MDAQTSLLLNRLLSRLENRVLTPLDGNIDARLQHDKYERSRVGHNIEYARTLLLTLEKQSATIRVQSERQRVQADLQRKRELIKQLQGKLQQLQEQDDGRVEDEESSDEEDEEDTNQNGSTVREYAPARADTEAGLDTGSKQDLPSQPPPAPSMRNRRPLQASDNRSAASTTAREMLFAGRPNSTPQTDPSLSKNEALLTHNRHEQETLTTSLLGLARQLKEQSQHFSSTLEAEKEVMKRAEGGLDQNARGMEAAEKRMGALRRMSEGQGWWGRIKLYGCIAGLWLGCFLLVFLVPKLRL
jgi:hypothetical protein